MADETLIQRFADGQMDRLPGLAADLVDVNVEVMIAIGSHVGGEALYYEGALWRHNLVCAPLQAISFFVMRLITFAVTAGVGQGALSWFQRKVRGVPRRQVLVFIHGFNNRFEDAVFRFAQVVHDSEGGSPAGAVADYCFLTTLMTSSTSDTCPLPTLLPAPKFLQESDRRARGPPSAGASWQAEHVLPLRVRTHNQ